MEALPLQDVVDVDGEELCDSLLELLDIHKQQQQRDIPTDTPPIASPLTKTTKIRPNTTKTHTQPNNRHKKKKKQKKVTPPKTKSTHEIKQSIVEVEEAKQYLQHLQNNPD